MSKKITVTPAEVRGWGNLIGEKTKEEYAVYEATLSSASETVDSRTRTVFTVTANITSSILNLTSSSSTIDLGQSVTLSGTLLDADSSAITGATVKIYLVDSSTPVTVTTGAGGAFSTTVTPSVGGVVSYYAVYDGDSSHDPGRSSNVNITVNKLTSTLSLAAVQSSIVVGSSPQLTGTLKYGSTGLTGKSVRIYRGTSLVDTVTTTTGGAFSFTDEATSTIGTLQYHAVFEGDSTYTSDESSTVEISVQDHVYSLTASASSTSILVGGSVTISGVLKRDNVAYGSQTVTVFKNDGESVSSETTTTDSSGAYSITFSNLSIGEITFWASAVSGSAVTDTITVTVSAHTYSLTAVASSQSITEGQSVTISGVYKEDNTGYSGQTITVYYKPDGGSESSTTTTTGSGGAYSVTLSGFLASGSPYTVWAETPDVESSEISVTVTAAVYTLTAVASSTSITEGESVTVTGYYKLNDVGLVGETIRVYYNWSYVTATTTNNGYYTATLTGFTSAESPYTVYSTDVDNVASSEITVTVAQAAPADLVVTGTKSILSYADSESSVLTATVTDSSSNPLSGQTVVFKNGSTTLDTKTTDSNGQCTYTYSSSGAGDVTITVECSLLQETYGIEDCYAYATSFTEWTSVTNKNTDFLFSPFQLPTNHRIEYKLKNTNGCQIACGDTTHTDGSGYLYWIYAWYGNNQRLYTRNSNMSDQTHSMSYTNSTTSVFALECSSNSLTLYKDSTVLKTATTYDTVGLTRLLRITSSYSSNIDWIKVKAL